MTKRLEAVTLLLLLFTFPGKIMAQIDVTAAQAANILVSKLAGHGVTILNTTLTCRAWASGTFKVVSSNLGLDSGIILTNGNAGAVKGPETILASTKNNTAGDPQLSQLAGQHTLDACTLEFDVIPQGDTIRFSYVFSSEEYISAVCGPYNDVFGFFISGPGITGQDNMALVPGTSIPVTINSINNGVPGPTGHLTNCTNMGPGSPFTSYYRDNTAGKTLTHRGFTSVLQATHRVNPCGVYHLKLAIADAGNDQYDSGVFLKAGSLESENFSVTAIRPTPKDTTAFCIKGCLPGKFVVKRSRPGGQPQTIRYIIGGNAVSGYDYSPMTDSVVIPVNSPSADVIINGLPTPPSGPKTIKLFMLTPGTCSSMNNIIDSASLIIYDTLHINLLTPAGIVCVGESVQLRVEGDSFLSYQWSPADGLNNPASPQPLATPAHDQAYHLIAYLPGTLCPVKTATAVVTTRLTPRVQLAPHLTLCYHAPLYLDAVTSDSNLFYSCRWTGPNNFTSTLPDPVIKHIVQDNAGAYTITVTNDTNGCKAIRIMDLQVNTPISPSVDGPIIFCREDPVRPLPVQGENLRWYRSGEDSVAGKIPDYSTDEVITYNLFATQTVGGCESPKTKVELKVERCCDGSIFLPNAFTPNSDGVNDKFRPVTTYGYFITGMRIVNRWGQLVYAGFDAWDGTLDGISAEAGTYFYRITFGCIRGGREERTGDVLLIR